MNFNTAVLILLLLTPVLSKVQKKKQPVRLDSKRASAVKKDRNADKLIELNKDLLQRKRNRQPSGRTESSAKTVGELGSQSNRPKVLKTGPALLALAEYSVDGMIIPSLIGNHLLKSSVDLYQLSDDLFYAFIVYLWGVEDVPQIERCRSIKCIQRNLILVYYYLLRNRADWAQQLFTWKFSEESLSTLEWREVFTPGYFPRKFASSMIICTRVPDLVVNLGYLHYTKEAFGPKPFQPSDLSGIITETLPIFSCYLWHYDSKTLAYEFIVKLSMASDGLRKSLKFDETDPLQKELCGTEESIAIIFFCWKYFLREESDWTKFDFSSLFKNVPLIKFHFFNTILRLFDVDRSRLTSIASYLDFDLNSLAPNKSSI